jgi:hypothetical protein
MNAERIRPAAEALGVALCAEAIAALACFDRPHTRRRESRQAKRREIVMSDLVGFFLGCVENDANSLSYHATGLERHASTLCEMPSLPSFRTRAEANLETAEAKLKAALDTVQKAQKGLRRARLKVAS